MKKIVSPLSAGGAPWTNDLLLNIQDEQFKVTEAIGTGLLSSTPTGNVGQIISGCVISGAGPYNCSAGVVLLSGVYMSFPGFTAQTLPQYILPLAAIVVTDTWADASSHNLTSDQQATFQSGVPGAGQYISLTTSSNVFARAVWTNVTLINGYTGNLQYFYNHVLNIVTFRGGISGAAGTNVIFAATGAVPAPASTVTGATSPTSFMPVWDNSGAAAKAIGVGSSLGGTPGQLKMTAIPAGDVDLAHIRYFTSN